MGETDDFRRRGAHFDVTVMYYPISSILEISQLSCLVWVIHIFRPISYSQAIFYQLLVQYLYAE